MLKEEPHQDKLRILGKINDLLQKPFNFPNDLECRIIFSCINQLKNSTKTKLYHLKLHSGFQVDTLQTINTFKSSSHLQF